MKVKDLRKLLENLDPETEVIMSIDPEGNGYCSLHDIDKGTIHPNDLGKQNIYNYYSDSHSDGMCDLQPGERDAFPKVICLWP